MGIPFEGIIEDLSKRRPYYKDDWYSGLQFGIRLSLHVHFIYVLFKNFFVSSFGQFRWNIECCRILAPTTYVFFASALPVIAFGEQLSRETGKQFSTMLVLNQNYRYLQIYFLLIVAYEYFHYHRWEFKHCGNSYVYGLVWYLAFHFWWTTSADIRSCRAHGYNVQLFVQLRQRKTGSWTPFVSSLGWLVTP